MKQKFFLVFAALCAVLLSGGCGLEIYNDWKQSGNQAITGAGAIAGKDYITGLTPSENARKYFARISGDEQPIETVSRFDDKESASGVRFVKNGGILIPPGVTISLENKGYCMDPHLPAPKAGDEFQLIPMTQLIPEDLQGTYRKLIGKAANGDETVLRNMQHLVWALRTAGTDAAYANNLTREQKKILDRCAEYPGQFEEFNANAKSHSRMLKELAGLADSFLKIKIGGVSYKASDLLDPDIGNKKINEHINQLIGMSLHLPVEKSGLNFGEIQPGIYTDVRGTGPLKYRAKIANTTNKSFIYYPSEYVGQVGSPAKNSNLTFFAAADTSMRQRVTGGFINRIGVLNDGNRHTNNNEDHLKPFLASDVNNSKKYKKFNSEKKAEEEMRRILENVLQKSKSEDKEYVVVTFYDPKNKKYYVSRVPQKGGTFSASIHTIVDIGGPIPYAYAHTHGDQTIEHTDGSTEIYDYETHKKGGYSEEDKLYDGKNFSTGDKLEIDTGHFKKGYLLNPDGEWKHYP